MTTDRPAAADVFLARRPMLVALAYRLLGSVHDAEDVAQEAYLRWAAAPRDTVANPEAFLTTVVTRLALDRFKSAAARRELYVGPYLPEPLPTADSDPAEKAALRETATMGMLVLLDRLNPAERAVFVLREAFDVPYPRIAEILDRTEASCRQLFHRAKQRTAKESPAGPVGAGEMRRRRDVVERFLAAAQGGSLEKLMDLLREDAVLVTDGGGKVNAALRPIHGAEKIARLYAKVFPKRFPEAVVTVTEYNHAPALLVRRPLVTYAYILDMDEDGRIARIYGIANPDKVNHLVGGRPRT